MSRFSSSPEGGGKATQKKLPSVGFNIAILTKKRKLLRSSAKLTTLVLPMYKHLTREQRNVISALLAKGFSLTDIANETQVAVAISTVSREIRRNRSKRKYSATVAQ